jgi:hypothetical protein
MDLPFYIWIEIMFINFPIIIVSMQISLMPGQLDPHQSKVTGEGANKMTVNKETGFVLW